jgi:hypothetical protein
MSDTQDIIAELRRGYYGYPLHRVAADRLTKLDARDQLRPPCPTCGGARVVKRASYGEFYDPCPDCVDGKVPMEWLVHVFNDLFDEKWIADDQVIRQLRGVR